MREPDLSSSSDAPRAIMGQKLPLGGYMGEDSFPGGDVTYTPPGDLTVKSSSECI